MFENITPLIGETVDTNHMAVYEVFQSEYFYQEHDIEVFIYFNKDGSVSADVFNYGKE